VVAGDGEHDVGRRSVAQSGARGGEMGMGKLCSATRVVIRR
jgi:hypothetical protein